MNVKQHTIKAPVTVSGVGLHTGKKVTMVFKPAEENHGFKFQRTDLENAPIVEADVDNVVDTSRGTTIEQNGARIHTVEHTLAALAGLQIDNVLIEIDAPEPPIMDGSSEPFIQALEKVGLQEQKEDRNYFDIPHNIVYSENDREVEMVAMPLDGFRMTVMVDYNSPVLGSQHATIHDMKEFRDEISSCRTFCFLHELETLLENGLIKGGDLNNAIVIVDRVVKDNELDHLAKLFNKQKVEVKKEGILNNVELRYQNEPARHKLLDLVGDLALIGSPIRGHIMAARPGHKANVAFAKKIKELIKKNKHQKPAPKYDPNAKPIFDVNQIIAMLPHRYPFLLVDKVTELSSKHIVGVKNVTMNEPFFVGHFPGDPVMPGVLQIEAMAQTGGILVLSSVENPEDYSTYFMKIEKARFKEKVLPGDTLVFRCELAAPIRRGICQMKAVAYVGNKIVCEAELMAQVVKNK
ncbi:MAG: UDP-3-O-[3-hydroxymyristoyl] N-acetylglucosamine deacetylase [Sphingobacteriales bacterium]|jgi:UDP-3-O-[3-hydroxymyristoyl] N-acetylglucosamine deacetylase/3-hydroxyacyl-[acyl-carrier-protein] dehydratase